MVFACDDQQYMCAIRQEAFWVTLDSPTRTHVNTDCQSLFNVTRNIALMHGADISARCQLFLKGHPHLAAQALSFRLFSFACFAASFACDFSSRNVLNTLFHKAKSHHSNKYVTSCPCTWLRAQGFQRTSKRSREEVAFLRFCQSTLILENIQLSRLQKCIILQWWFGPARRAPFRAQGYKSRPINC